MKETIYRCDICHTVEDPDEMIHTESGKDVCVDCMANLIDKHFADQEKKFTEILESASAKKPVPLKKKPAAAEKKIDWGAAQALRDAGWSITKIAKELKCSEQTVYNHTKPAAETKKKRPFEWNAEDMARLGYTDKEEIEEVMAK